MSSKKKANRKCRCGKPGTYRYSYELATWLKLHPWVGVYLCNRCMTIINEEWKEAQGEPDAVDEVGQN